ncbi:Retrovirus-related Pol polyprotein from transposon TNT 1-94 [Dendrobium catenatum]|uniref:Retrovirus-related Pol polyprotein from transposon TNT 1-94 n=1 Tax=Dendrobium catenatum TaxID=906689 RepID=A0A2I0W3M4_9ASPA|nr:Retrovirus-related Pol polyprotein from transposon TNT 1-94 [Dendrobium catenatum]
MAESPTSSTTITQSQSSIIIPPQLKFVLSNIKNLVANPLTSDNYPLWRSQVEKIFAANGFQGFLDGSSQKPPQDSSNTSSYAAWQLLDQNLAAALFSIITPSILPYVLSLTHCADIWATLTHRLQASNRSRIIQLKNELHNLTKGDQTMSQYLLTIKSKVDAISAAGSALDPEDVILYTLNGLPTTYQAFKTAIRTNLQPITLDDLYTLLCSEEVNLAQEASKSIQQLQLTDNTTALAAARGRGRGRNYYPRGGRQSNRNSPGNSSNNNSSIPERYSNRNIICQICAKQGHSAAKCWYRHDTTHQDSNSRPALFSPTEVSRQNEWFLDSGASTHLTSDASQLSTTEPYRGNSQVTLGNGHNLSIRNTGTGILPTPSGSLQLNKLHHVPNLSFNLLSVYQLTHDNSCIVSFSSRGYVIQDSTTKRVLLQGPCHNGLYSISTSTSPANLALLSVQTVPDLWHGRLGHPDTRKLQHLAQLHLNISSTISSKYCNTCNLAKSHRLPSSNSFSSTYESFEIVHSDVWGPSPTISLNGFRYFVTFIDEHTKYCWVYPLTLKSDVFSKFQEFYNMVRCQFNKNIKTLRTDGGGEYINKSFEQFCKTFGLRHQYTCPHTPSQNGLAERKNIHILETVRSLLIHYNAPHSLWVHALHTAIHIINRLPTRKLKNKTPHKSLYNTQPSYNHLKIFGCLCYLWLKPYAKSKLDSFSKPCVFIGYPPAQKGYLCLDPDTNLIYTSHHVVFNEQIFPYHRTQSTVPTPNSSPNIPPLLLVLSSLLPSHIHQQQTVPTPSPIRTSQTNQNSGTNHTTPNLSELQPVTIPGPAPLHTSSNITAPNNTTHHMITRSKTGHLKPKQILNLTHQLVSQDPTSYTQAAQHEHWRSAMSQEFQALQSQGTWELVPYSPTQNILGCKWTFRTKYNSDGSIARYKARLVALGYNQEFGIDYTETFSPVAKIPTFRILILLALHKHWPMHQLDISNAFLHGSLHETVYMKQPPGFVDTNHPNHICKLNKALYGLKQSPRQWFATLTGFLHTQGFRTSSSDPSLMIFQQSNIQIYFLIYVDDLIVTGNNEAAVRTLRSKLQNRFNTRNRGHLSQFLGITALPTSDGLLLHQRRYAQSILQRAGMTNCKPTATPIIAKSHNSSQPSKPFFDPLLYR